VTWNLTLPTIWDFLLSSNVSAHYYYDGSSFIQTPLVMWGTKYTSIEYGTSQFYADCASASLPSVSFVDPEMTSTTALGAAQDQGLAPAGVDTGGNDDHPHADIRNGEAFLSRIYNAIASSPQWSSTVFIINFDEWGGFYDHVVPPVVPSEQVPDAESSAYAAVGLFPSDPTYGSRGFRVPCLVISPWSHSNVVNHIMFDHTSVLKLIEDRWGLPNLTTRDLNATDLTNVMDFAHPDYSTPIQFPAVPSGSPYGGFCKSIQIARQTDGTLAALWDSTCLKVILQTAPTLYGPWTDQPNILTPPYVLAPTAGSVGAFLIRFKVLGSGYVTPPL
jgi:phospholipase C